MQILQAVQTNELAFDNGDGVHLSFVVFYKFRVLIKVIKNEAYGLESWLTS